MNEPKVSDLDYINFLVASPTVFSCTEAARVQPDIPRRAAHDALTRLLHRLAPDSTPLWTEAQQHVILHAGLLIVDDTTLDKPYANKIELVSRHWSGKHGRVVSGINLLTLLWTQSSNSSRPLVRRPLVPCDFRLYDAPQDGLTKNDHFQTMLRVAKARSFAPAYVLFDSWYSGLDNLKLVRELGWHFLTRLKSNRQINPDKSGLVAVSTWSVPQSGQVVHLKGFGLIRLFQTAAPNGDVEQWATSDLEMTAASRQELEQAGWGIESYHRGLKQCCGAERAQMRSARAQRNHLRLCLQAFLRLEAHRLQTDIGWYEAKTSLIREAVRAYLAHPLFHLPSTA